MSDYYSLLLPLGEMEQGDVSPSLVLPDSPLEMRERVERFAVYFKREMHFDLPQPAFAPVRDQFQSWVAELWRDGVARRNRRLPPEIIASAVWVPSNEATARLGISLGRLKHLIAEGVIDGEEKVSLTGRRFLTVRKDQLDSITSQNAGEMDMKTAMNVLGFGKVRMRQLLRLLFPGACRVVTGTAT